MQTAQPPEPSWNAVSIASWEPSLRSKLIEMLTHEERALLLRMWRRWAHQHQIAPGSDWAVWLLIGGRGAGKTKAGAEYVNAEASAGRAKRIGLIGETFQDARSVMVEGVAGLLAPADPAMRPQFTPTS